MQEIFDKIVSAMVDQGEPSKADGRCFYRLVSGNKILKCAVGQIISDEQIARYDISEGSSVCGFSSPLFEEIISDAFTSEIRWLLAEFQSAHDEPVLDDKTFIEAFIERSNRIANLKGLTPYSGSGIVAQPSE